MNPAKHAFAAAPDSYAKGAAAFLLSRLDSCSGCVSGYAESDAANAVLGQAWRVQSDYPSWYSAITSGDRKYDGDLVREALARMAAGEAPNIRQREARWVVDRIDAARVGGDQELDLPAMEGRTEGKGGARPGVKQTRLRESRMEGQAIERIPVRATRGTLATLRRMAADRGMTLNALVVGVLDGVAEAENERTAEKGRMEGHVDEIPF